MPDLISHKAARRVREVMSEGGRKADLATHFKVSESALDKMLADDERLARSYEQGLSAFHSTLLLDVVNPERILTNPLYDGYSDAQVVAIMKQKAVNARFILESRFGYNEAEIETAAFNVQINLPASMDAVSFKQAAKNISQGGNSEND